MKHHSRYYDTRMVQVRIVPTVPQLLAAMEAYFFK